MNEIAALSNERLEDSIASYYWELHRAKKWTVKPKSPVLEQLWDEFDYRVREGVILVE